MEEHCVAFAKAVSKQRFPRSGNNQPHDSRGTASKETNVAQDGGEGDQTSVAKGAFDVPVDNLLPTTISTLLSWCKAAPSAKVLLESARALWSLSLQPAVLDLM